jgi:hypothetical protein
MKISLLCPSRNKVIIDGFLPFCVGKDTSETVEATIEDSAWPPGSLFEGIHQ